MGTRKSILYILLICILALSFPPPLRAQGGTLRGQIFGPDGNPLSHELRFQIVSSDGSFQNFYFTDSNGRIVVPRLSPGKTYSLIVEGDNTTFDGVNLTFNLENIPYLNVFLPPREPLQPQPFSVETVSAEAAAETVPPEAERLYHEAMELVKKDDLDEAVKKLNTAIERHPVFFQAHNDLGVVYLKWDRFAEARESLNRAAELKPEDYRPWLNLGLVSVQEKRFDDAVLHLQKARTLNPDFSDIHRHLGEALLETGRLDEAEKELMAAAEAQDGNRPVALIKLAIIKVERNDTPAATKLLETYLAEFPRASNRSEIQAILKLLRP